MSIPPIYEDINPAFLAALEGLPTPVLAYDLDHLAHTVTRLQEDLRLVPGARLGFALKSCREPSVLASLAQSGLLADAASGHEYDVSRGARFAAVSCMGLKFSDSELLTLTTTDAMVDAATLEQFRFLVASAGAEARFGVRLRVPTPEADLGPDTFGSNSRFGVVPDAHVLQELSAAGARLVRLHVHIGQCRPELMLSKAHWLLAVAERLPHVREINLGGGFFYFYQERARAREAYRRIATMLADFQARTGRALGVIVEPGALVTTRAGVLVTRVISAERSAEKQVLTVDSSAWDAAPWSICEVRHLDAVQAAGEDLETVIGGDTCYEADTFNIGYTPRTRPTGVGERIVLTNMGSYTGTNHRSLHGGQHLPAVTWSAEAGVRHA